MMRVIVVIALVIFTSVGVSAQATSTPTPSPTGTALAMPVFPPLPTYAPTQLTPQVWGTLTPIPAGSPFAPPTFPAQVGIPEAGQQLGFGAIGQENSEAMAIWLVETGVQFWNWTKESTDDAWGKFQLVFAVALATLIIVSKFGKYRGGGAAGMMGMSINRAERKAAKQAKEDPNSLKRSFALFFIPFLFLQQGSCADNQPCYGIPWRFPQYPVLLSPTPFPTTFMTVVSTPTPTPTPGAGTPTAIPPTATAGIDVALINDQLSTLQSIAAATPMQMSAQIAPQNVAGNVQNVYSFILGLQAVNFGIFQPFIDLGFFGFFTWLGIRLTFMLLPLIARFIGLIRRVVQLLLDFLPF